MAKTAGRAGLFGFLILAGLALLAACGGDEDDGGDSLRVEDAFVRSAGQDVAAVYFTIQGGGEDDRLLSAASSAANIAQLHEVITDGNSTQMQQVEGIEIGAGETIAFEPGSYHVMLIELQEDLEIGDLVEIELDFENAGSVVVEADVEGFTDREESGEDE